MKSLIALSLLTVVLTIGVGSAYAEEKYECEMIESCGEIRFNSLDH